MTDTGDTWRTITYTLQYLHITELPSQHALLCTPTTTIAINNAYIFLPATGSNFRGGNNNNLALWPKVSDTTEQAGSNSSSISGLTFFSETYKGSHGLMQGDRSLYKHCKDPF